jgi:2-methylcitrate dehydratase PrpD
MTNGARPPKRPVQRLIDPVAISLAQFAQDVVLSAVPLAVRQRAQHLILDAIGCAMAARSESFVGPFFASTRALNEGAIGASGVVGFKQRLPLRDAALMNGVLMHGLDYDDTHTAGVVHLTVSVLPAVLGVASLRGCSGSEMLMAYITGIETGARIAMAAKGGFHTQGFHPTGMVGVFAASLAAGRLLGLQAKQLVQTQGLALSLASGSLQFLEDGAWTKRLHAGWAAQAGITAATMVSHGVVAPNAPYTGRFGLFHSFLNESTRQTADSNLAQYIAGSTWELMQVAIKPYAMCHFVHAAIDAAIALHKDGINTDQIDIIEVLVPDAAVPLVCEPIARKRRPDNDYDAKFSLPYAVASGLLRGKLGLQELKPEAYRAPQILTLMDRVSYRVDPTSTFPLHYSGEVRITMRDASVRSKREAINRGHGDRPLLNAEVCEKFMANATLHFSKSHAEDILATVLDVENLPSVTTLESLLAGTT